MNLIVRLSSGSSFWSLRDKLPSIMSFFTRSTAPRLAFLCMEVQKAIFEHEEPTQMDANIRAPRFVIAPTQEKSAAINGDLGTFAMTTATEAPYLLPPKPSVVVDDVIDARNMFISRRTSARHYDIQYTDYQISCSHSCVFLVSIETARSRSTFATIFIEPNNSGSSQCVLC